MKSMTKKDFKLEWFSGTGPGGQRKNKVQCCCRITHIETGLKTQSTEHRTRVANQKDAFNRLAKMLIQHYKVQEIKQINEEVIRTYHAERNEVIDHASGHRDMFSNIEDDIRPMVKARKEATPDDSS